MKVGDVVDDFVCIGVWTQPDGKHGLKFQHQTERHGFIIGFLDTPTDDEIVLEAKALAIKSNQAHADRQIRS